jgi:acetylornithine deacetylase
VRPDPLSPDAVLGLLQELIRIPSVNPSLAPEEGQGESEVAAFACRWLTDRGIRAWLEEAAPGRPNAVAEVGEGDGPCLILCAHLDTVATAGMSIPPFEPQLSEGRVYGRGSYDMKGAAAAAMSAVVALASERLAGKVILALVADEEHASLGAQDFLCRRRDQRMAGCILTEPSEGRLLLAHKGFVWVEIETSGRAAHGSRWDLGQSAIGRMGRIVAALERFDTEVLRRRRHPLLGPASLHCARIEGGVGLSTYAPACRLEVERRTLPGESPEQVLAELADVVREAGEEARITALLDRPPLLCDREAAVAREVRRAVAAVTGREPEEAGVGFWMDAALFAQAGIPTVDYGPTGAGAHEAVEWVDAASVVTTSRILAEAARRFCTGGI